MGGKVNCRIKPVHKPEVGTSFTVMIIGIMGSHSTTIRDRHPPLNKHNDCAIVFIFVITAAVSINNYFCYSRLEILAAYWLETNGIFDAIMGSEHQTFPVTMSPPIFVLASAYAMSNSHYCQVHIVNNLTQQLAAAFAARETIEAYSRTLCHLLILCCTVRDQYQDLALGMLLHDIMVTLQSMSRAYDCIIELSTVQDLPQMVSSNSCPLDKT
jgi:hypothetical protein